MTAASRPPGPALRTASGLPRGRVPLLAGAGLALLIGVWTGLARAGVHDAVGPVGAHGVIMALRFLGTLIALERAVALRARWAYAAPALAAASVVWLTAGLPAEGAGGLLTVAGVIVVAAYGVMLARHAESHLVLMAAGGVAWVVAAALWTVGWSPFRLAPSLAAFLVLTIVGERLELSRLRMPSLASRRRLAAAATLSPAVCWSRWPSARWDWSSRERGWWPRPCGWDATTSHG